MFTYKSEFSNIRGISVSDTGTGALIGIVLAGQPDYEASIENLALEVRVEYGDRRQREIDVLVRDALVRAMLALQHELELCDSRGRLDKFAANA